MNNALNVSVGKPMAAGGVYAAALPVAPPTNAVDPLPSVFVGLGYCSDDGLTNSVDISTETVTAWGGDAVLTVRTSQSETFSWTFIESLNAEVLKQVYGADNVVEGADGIAFAHSTAELPAQCYVFEILMTGNKIKRIVVPNGKITEIGDVTYTDGDPIGYEVTLACSPDAQGVTVYEYIADIAGDDNGAGGGAGGDE